MLCYNPLPELHTYQYNFLDGMLKPEIQVVSYIILKNKRRFKRNIYIHTTHEKWNKLPKKIYQKLI